MAISGRNWTRREMTGQTVIETIFMLILLLILFFLIAEFARAWYLKNSLNNAVRVAVREAVVTPDLAPLGSPENCPSSDAIVNAVCASPGVPDTTDTEVFYTRTEDIEPIGGDFSPGDTVTVIANSVFRGIAFGFILPEYAESGASMRYE